MVQDISQVVQDTCAERGLNCTIELRHQAPAVHADKAIVQVGAEGLSGQGSTDALAAELGMLSCTAAQLCAQDAYEPDRQKYLWLHCCQLGQPSNTLRRNWPRP